MKRELITLMAISLVGLIVSACGDDDDDGGTAATTPAGNGTTAPAEGSPGADEPQAFASENFSLPVTGEASTAWTIADDNESAFVLEHAQAEGFINLAFPLAVYSYDGLTEEDVPADPVAWWKAHPEIDIVSEEAVTIGGIDGVQLEVTSDDEDTPALYETTFEGGNTFHLFPNDHFNLVVLDTSEGPLFLAFGSDDATRYSEIIPEAQPVLDSLEFGS
jgi:hypothetical protein